MANTDSDDQKKEPLEMKLDKSTDSVKIAFKGAITEVAKINAVELKEKKSLVLDFNDISYINSAGVRRWILWMWNIEKEFPNVKIIIERCPTIMYKQIITVMRFVPKMTQVRSFYIPFFCENCEESSLKMFISKPLLGLKDKDFFLQISGENCKKCGATLVVDASLEQFNKFINDYKSD